MDADLVIVGGGLVGASLAVAVCSNPSSAPLSVVLIDPSPPPTDSLAEHQDDMNRSHSTHWPAISLRTSTINPSTQEFLSDIGVWQHIPHSRLSPVDSMVVWEHEYPEEQVSHEGLKGVMHFRSADIGKDILAYVLDNSTLRHALYLQIKRLVSDGRLSVLPLSVSDIQFGNDSEHQQQQHNQEHHQHADIDDDSVDWPVVHLSDGTRIHSRLIAACDGGRSKIRTLANADWISYEYKQRAVVANVRITDPSCTAWQRFVDTGPLAVLPVASSETYTSSGETVSEAGSGEKRHERSTMTGPMANVVWTMNEGEALALTQASDHVFLDELNIALSSASHDEDFDNDTPSSNRVIDSLFSQVLSPLTTPAEPYPPLPQCAAVIGPRASFPLVSGHAPRYVLPERRTVLVGDAAHSVHPLAGQGVNLGFADARAVADCVAAAAGAGRDIGGESGAPLRAYEAERMPANLAAVAGLHGLRAMFAVGRGRVGGSRLGAVAGSFRRAGLSMVDGISPVKQSILRLMR